MLPRIEKWCVYNQCLLGRIYGHPGHKDGCPVITSRIRLLDFERGVAVLEKARVQLGEYEVDHRRVYAQLLARRSA
jgi:hypothetical protein